MHASIHIHTNVDTPAFKADLDEQGGYDTLDIHDDRGNTITVFLNTYEQAQQLVEAAVELRRGFRIKRDADVVAELTV